MPRPGGTPMRRSRKSWPGRAAGSAAFGDRRGRAAAVLGRDPGAGVCAGAGTVLGRRGRDLRHGARHRDHGCRDRHASRSAPRPGPGASPPPAPAMACSPCAASRSVPRRDHRLRRAAAHGLYGERADDRGISDKVVAPEEAARNPVAWRGREGSRIAPCSVRATRAKVACGAGNQLNNREEKCRRIAENS